MDVAGKWVKLVRNNKAVSLGINMLVILALAVFVVFLVSSFFFSEARESASGIRMISDLATEDKAEIGTMISDIPTCYQAGDLGSECEDPVCCGLTYAQCKLAINEGCVWEIR